MITILMVDDNARLLSVLSRALSGAGYHVLPVESAEEALELLGMMRPDALICDISLEGMSGVELCRRIQAHPLYCDLPVVLMSGHDTSQTLGCSPAAVLQKPVTLQQIVATLTSVLEKSRHV
jgi:CheY-like chemotaxis protein